MAAQNPLVTHETACDEGINPEGATVKGADHAPLVRLMTCHVPSMARHVPLPWPAHETETT